MRVRSSVDLRQISHDPAWTAGCTLSHRERTSTPWRAAQAEIEQEAHRAREELRGQVSAVALAGAEKILKREIDAKAHDDILGELAREL